MTSPERTYGHTLDSLSTGFEQGFDRFFENSRLRSQLSNAQCMNGLSIVYQWLESFLLDKKKPFK
jgi:hypothetical protein